MSALQQRVCPCSDSWSDARWIAVDMGNPAGLLLFALQHALGTGWLHGEQHRRIYRSWRLYDAMAGMYAGVPDFLWYSLREACPDVSHARQMRSHRGGVELLVRIRQISVRFAVWLGNEVRCCDCGELCRLDHINEVLVYPDSLPRANCRCGCAIGGRHARCHDCVQDSEVEGAVTMAGART